MEQTVACVAKPPHDVDFVLFLFKMSDYFMRG